MLSKNVLRIFEGYWLGFAARCRNLKQRAAKIRAEDDHSLADLRPAGHPRGVTEDLRRAACEINAFEFAL